MVVDQYGDPVPDGTPVVFNTNHGTLGLSTVPTSGGVASADLTSESSTETVIATVTATADSVSDATAVFFIPFGGVEVWRSQTETVSGSGTITDTLTGGDVSINATGDHSITIAEYADNPGDMPNFLADGDFYDVHLDDDANVYSLIIEFCPATITTIIYYWDDVLGWWEASDQVYDSDKACVWVYINSDTFPSLSDLSGLVFAPGISSVHADAIRDLIDDIEEIELNQGIENSLVSKLENALKSLVKRNNGAAVNQLNAFINEVEAQEGKEITIEQADELITKAEEIIYNI